MGGLYVRITVLGGDKRNIKLAELLTQDNHNVKVFGFNQVEVNEVEIVDNLDMALKDSQVIIGPIPCITEDIYLNTPLYHQKIKIEDVLNTMQKDNLFLAGKIPRSVWDISKEKDIKVEDLLSREEMAILNAIPTAEGAIEIAMKELDITIHGSNAMVLGFGRIGKLLAKFLQGLGANPYILARKHSDIAWIKAYGYKPVFVDDLKNYLRDMDIIFNTIPSKILTESNLKEIKKDSLIIDLASVPGGVDINKAKELELKVIWALGLPGKVASKTAANIMKSTIYNVIEELGVGKCC